MVHSVSSLSNYVPPDLKDKEKFSKLKSQLIKPENAEKVKDSWKRLLVALEQMATEIEAEKSDYIPEVDWNTVKKNNGIYPTDVTEKFKQRGAMIVRNVVSRETALKWKDSMTEFVGNHPEIGGYPSPITNWFAFWTSGEVQARSHPEIIKLMESMSQFFNIEDETLPVDKDSTVVYPDAFRVRPPGVLSTLDLHLDAGSIERWEDPTYRSLYAPILEGRWEEWDPWRLDERAFAKTDLYSHLETRPTATSAFRALQGWLAMSDSKSGEGTLRILPNIKLVNAYSVLRPFFWRDDGEIDLETPKFPGVIVGSGQFFCTELTHPHLRHLQTVHSISHVQPGDYVFWHCDTAHEVDKQHSGTTDSSVFFNAYCPLSPYNVQNMVATKDAFLSASTPIDFRKDKKSTMVYEGNFSDHGAKQENILSEEGLQAMGLKKFEESGNLTPGQLLARRIANEAMETGKIPAKYL